MWRWSKEGNKEGRKPLFLWMVWTDDAAGNLFSGVAAGLGVKIVRILVDDHSPAQNLAQPEAAGPGESQGFAAAGQQRRQIPGMVRVGTPQRVKMAFGVRKLGFTAVRSFVNMESVEALRQPLDRCGDENKIRPFIKLRQAPELRAVRPSLELGYGLGRTAEQPRKHFQGTMAAFHRVTSRASYVPPTQNVPGH